MTKSSLPAGCIVVGVDGSEHAARAVAWAAEQAAQHPRLPELDRTDLELITIDPDEIRDARWFTRDELRSIDTLGLRLPRADSIARRLIEDWLENT